MKSTNQFEVVKKAVSWWSEFLLQKPTREHGMNVNVFRTESDSIEALDKSSVDAFAQALFNIIMENMETCEQITLSTDYEPKEILLQAAIESHIPDMDERFPMKVIMKIESSMVIVKYGYGAPFERL